MTALPNELKRFNSIGVVHEKVFNFIRLGILNPLLIRKAFVPTLTVDKLLAKQLGVRPVPGSKFSRLRLLKVDFQGVDQEIQEEVLQAAMDFFVNTTGSAVATMQFPCVVSYANENQAQKISLVDQLSRILKYKQLNVTEQQIAVAAAAVSLDGSVRENLSGEEGTAQSGWHYENWSLFVNCNCPNDDIVMALRFMDPPTAVSLSRITMDSCRKNL
jgi:hypothetical protein